jgi:hypothetical protein
MNKLPYLIFHSGLAIHIDQFDLGCVYYLCMIVLDCADEGDLAGPGSEAEAVLLAL